MKRCGVSGGRDGRVYAVSVEKCGGGVRKCVGVREEVGCVEKCGEGGVCGKMWGRCGKVYWGAGEVA